MKRMSILFILMIFGFLNINVLAEEDIFACTNDELSRIKEVAKKVEINYEYEFKEINQNGETIRYPVYSLVATNLSDEIKVLIIKNYLSGDYKEFKNGKETTASLNGFSEGEKVNITIKAFTPNKCSGKTVRSIVVKLPYYNNFSEEDICKVYPEFKYCSEFVDQTIQLDTFNQEIEKYIELQEVEVNNDEVKEDNWTLLIIIGIIVAILFITLIISMIVIKIRKKSEL